MAERLTDLLRTIRNRVIVRNSLAEALSGQRYLTAMGETLCTQGVNPSAFPSRFVILKFPRVGGDVLSDTLNRHPEILCHQEIFNPTRINYANDFHELVSQDAPLSRYALVRGKLGLATIAERNRWPEKFLVNLWLHNCGAKAVGFSLLPHHIPNMATALLRDKGVKKVLLVRKNKIEAYVHSLVNQQLPFGLDPQDVEPPSKITVDSQALMHWSQRHDRYLNRLRHELSQTGQPYLEIAYEDLNQGCDELLKARLLKHIGVSVKLKHLSVPAKSSGRRHLPDLVRNFDQLRQQLQGTALEPFLLERA